LNSSLISTLGKTKSLRLEWGYSRHTAGKGLLLPDQLSLQKGGVKKIYEKERTGYKTEKVFFADMVQEGLDGVKETSDVGKTATPGGTSRYGQNLRGGVLGSDRRARHWVGKQSERRLLPSGKQEDKDIGPGGNVRIPKTRHTYSLGKKESAKNTEPEGSVLFKDQVIFQKKLRQRGISWAIDAMT